VATFVLKYTSRHKQLASVLFLFFQLVSILSLLISFSFISLLVLISSSFASLCTISAVQLNINYKSTSISSAQFISLPAHEHCVSVCVAQRGEKDSVDSSYHILEHGDTFGENSCWSSDSFERYVCLNATSDCCLAHGIRKCHVSMTLLISWLC